MAVKHLLCYTEVVLLIVRNYYFFTIIMAINELHISSLCSPSEAFFCKCLMKMKETLNSLVCSHDVYT